MDKFEFITYAARRYGIDESAAEYMVDMFTATLQDVITSGQDVNIDEIGEFKTTPLLSHLKGNIENTVLVNLARRKIVTFTASKNLQGIV